MLAYLKDNRELRSKSSIQISILLQIKSGKVDKVAAVKSDQFAVKQSYKNYGGTNMEKGRKNKEIERWNERMENEDRR